MTDAELELLKRLEKIMARRLDLLLTITEVLAKVVESDIQTQAAVAILANPENRPVHDEETDDSGHGMGMSFEKSMEDVKNAGPAGVSERFPTEDFLSHLWADEDHQRRKDEWGHIG